VLQRAFSNVGGDGDAALELYCGSEHGGGVVDGHGGIDGVDIWCRVSSGECSRCGPLRELEGVKYIPQSVAPPPQLPRNSQR